jgi:hypothetical protein
MLTLLTLAAPACVLLPVPVVAEDGYLVAREDDDEDDEEEEVEDEEDEEELVETSTVAFVFDSPSFSAGSFRLPRPPVRCGNASNPLSIGV